jgi:magnesium transporter
MIEILETIDNFRDLLSGMIEIHLSAASNKMNEVMKVLTIIATIFIPLTFIAGVYGMNFKFMPELNWKVGYFLVLLFMGAVAGVMLLYFWKKKWL